MAWLPNAWRPVILQREMPSNASMCGILCVIVMHLDYVFLIQLTVLKQFKVIHVPEFISILYYKKLNILLKDILI